MGLRVALSQLNPIVGDLQGNVTLMSADYQRAVQAGAQVVVFPELSVTGYPPEDLLLKGAFIADNQKALEEFAAATGPCAAVVGFVLRDGTQLFNAAAVCVNGAVRDVYRKQLRTANVIGHILCVLTRC